MPITPFHLGPGLALKAAAEERFSFVICVLCGVAGAFARRDRLRYPSLSDRCG